MYSTRESDRGLIYASLIVLGLSIMGIITLFGLAALDSNLSTKSISNSLDISQAKAQSIQTQLDDYNVNYSGSSKFVKTETGFKLYSKDSDSNSIIFNVNLKGDKITNVSKG